MSSLFVISVLFMLISVGKLFLLLFLEIISFIVFHVFLISDLYLVKVDARNCCLAARMFIFNILLYVLRLIYIISFSLEVGFVNFILLYRLSWNLFEFSSLHLDFLCLYLLNFTNLHDMLIFCLFNFVMYSITYIRICGLTFI